MIKFPLSPKRIFFFSGFGLAVAAPLAVMASCGSSDAEESTTKTPSYRDKLNESFAKAAYFTTDSVSSNLKSTPLQLDSIAKSYQYLSGNYSTLSLAKAAAASEWQNTLPTTTDFVKTKRNLWIRVIPKTETEIGTNSPLTVNDLQALSGDNQYFNVTTFSKIRAIKSDVAQQTTFNTLNLANISLTGTVDAPTLNLNNLALPEGAALEFVINNDTIKPVNLVDYIKSNKNTLTATQLANIKVRVGVTDATLYVVSTLKEVTIGLTVASYRLKLVTNLSAAINYPTTASSTNPQFASVTLDPIAKEYKYLSGNYPTLAAAKAAPSTEWKSALPTTVDFTKSARYLWLQVVTKTAAELGVNSPISNIDLDSLSGDNQFFDLTSSSRIQQIKSDVAQQATFASLNLSGITLNGSLDLPTVFYNNLILPEGADYEFVVNNVAVKRADFATYITTNKAAMTTIILDNIKVRLVVTDSTQYVLNSTKESVIVNTIDLTNGYAAWAAKYPQYANKVVGNRVIENAFKDIALPAGFSLPSSVTIIGTNAFLRATLPAGFNLPSSVTTFEQLAFAYVNLPDSFTMPTSISSIGYGAFTWAQIPAGFTLPRSITRIEKNAFANAIFPYFFTLPEAVETIDDEAFREAFLPEGFALPAGLKTIGTGAFYKAQIPSTLNIPASVTAIGNGAFGDAILPADFRWPSGASVVNNETFAGSTLPAGFVLPSGVASIGNNAFFNAKLPSAFPLPNTLIAIGNGAFMRATLPSGFTIPSSVTVIGSGAFSLTTLPTGFIWPSNITTINSNMFANSTLPSGFTIPSTVTTINFGAFTNANLPTGFTVPPTVTTVVSGAFTGAKIDGAPFTP